MEKPRENIFWEENCRWIDVDRWNPMNGKIFRNNKMKFQSYLNINGKPGGFSRTVDWSADYPFLQVKVPVIEETPGYKSWIVNIDKKRLITLSGMYCPGIFTFNTADFFAEQNPFKNNKCRLGFTQFSGIYTYEYIRMTSLPKNSLIVKIIPNMREKQNSRLIEEITRGDKLVFIVSLEKPAKDVTITVHNSYCMTPVSLDGKQYIQLLQKDEAGKEWQAEVNINKKAPAIQRIAGGIVFKGTVLGGDVKCIYTVNSVPLNL